MHIKIYHNPRCSKSRKTLVLLEDQNVDFETILYLQTPLSSEEIRSLITQLGFSSPRDLMRTGEAVYKDLGLKDVSDEDALIAAMVDHPILIERPIVVNGERAKIGRPPENVLEIL